MLIIFDLDDTLIDTSGCITPIKLQHALRRMIEEGLFVSDCAAAVELLMRLDNASESSEKTLSEFLEIMHADPKFLEIGVEEVYDKPLPSDITISVLEGAMQMLDDLRQLHRLALVTIGKEEQQRDKLKKAGIDSEIFTKIIVSEARDKKPHYQNIMNGLGYRPSDVVACGDRIERDLVPARELGCKTVHVRWGRGLNATGKKENVDYSVSALSQLKNIIDNLRGVVWQ